MTSPSPVDTARLRELLAQVTAEIDEDKACLRCHQTYSLHDGYERTALCDTCTRIALDAMTLALPALLSVLDAAAELVDSWRDTRAEDVSSARLEQAVDEALNPPRLR